MSSSANLPAPYQGKDDEIPLAAIRSPYCQTLFNFNVTPAGISLRTGDSKFKVQSLSGGDGIPIGIPKYAQTTIFLVVVNTSTFVINIYNLETGTLAYTSASTGSAGLASLEFRSRLFLMFGTSHGSGFVYDGTSWGTTGWTGTGFSPFGGAVFKNRAYIIQFRESAYWYSDVDAVSGAMTKVDLTGVVYEKGELMVIAPLTISDNVATEFFLSLVFSTGEVLFYSGSYPNSDSWRLMGRANIGPPLNYNCGVSYQGDYLVPTDVGVISLRDLFLKGSEGAVSSTINSKIQNEWRELVSAIRVAQAVPVGPVYGVSAAWDYLRSRIIFSFGFYLDSAGDAVEGSYYFVFNTKLAAWTTQRSYQATGGFAIDDITAYQNKVMMMPTTYGAASSVVIYEKEGSTGFQDRNVSDDGNVSYEYSMISAPIPFPKTSVYEAVQIEPILESDLFAETNWNFVVDFGRQTSGDQKTDALTTSVSKPAVNVGMQNITYVQVKMSGTTAASKTVGLDLYSYNVWYNSGETGSR